MAVEPRFEAVPDGVVVEAEPAPLPDGQMVTERTIEIVNTYDHDTSLYTQGLEFVDGLLLESGGLWGESVLRIYDPVSGQVVSNTDVDDELFAEGATVFNDEVWQLSWQAETALVYSLDDLELDRQVSYQGEGWGLCTMGDRFIMSNGSDQLTFRRTDDFASVGSVPVTLRGRIPIEQLNELECIPGSDGDDRVWANVYLSNTIYGIEPNSGTVTDVVDASELVPPGFEEDGERVLNGIAYNPDTGNFWLTGKQWPVLYEVKLN